MAINTTRTDPTTENSTQREREKKKIAFITVSLTLLTYPTRLSYSLLLPPPSLTGRTHPTQGVLLPPRPLKRLLRPAIHSKPRETGSQPPEQRSCQVLFTTSRAEVLPGVIHVLPYPSCILLESPHAVFLTPLSITDTS